DLLERPISAGGAVGSPVLISANWATMGNPSVVASGAKGLDVFVGAIRSVKPTETITNLARFSSANGGAGWSVDPDKVSNTGAAYAGDVSAALGSDGTPYVTWGSSDCLCVHRGASPSAANFDFQQGLGDFGYEPGIGVDTATGQVVVAWYSNGTGHAGIYAAPVNPATGARATTAVQMPGTADLLAGPFSSRTPA